MSSTSVSPSRTGLLGALMIILAVPGAVALFWSLVPAEPLALARTAYKAGDWKRSSELAREQIKHKPNDLEAYRWYARSLIRLGRDEPGAGIYNTKFTPETLEAEDRHMVGLAFAHVGQLDKALLVWEESADKDPDAPEFLDHLSRLAFKIQHLDRAADSARRLAALPGHEAHGLLLEGEVQNALGNPHGAVAALARGLELDPQAVGLPADAAYYRRLLARNLLVIGRADDAKKQLLPLLKTSAAVGTAAETEVPWLLSRAYLQLGDLPEASRMLAQSRTYAADHPEMPEPSPYTGAERCTKCHREIAESYKPTRHNRTFYHGEQLLDQHRPDKPLPDPDNPRITHAIVAKDKELYVRTDDGKKLTDMLIEYAFGTRDLYLTMVARDKERNYRALRLSYHNTNEGTGWDKTSGDSGHADSEDSSLGQKIAVQDGIVRCLACHTTNPRNFRDPAPPEGKGPEAADSAIGCEACHGPGKNHIAAIDRGFGSTAIFNTGAKSAEVIDNQCTKCHIVGDRRDIELDPTNPNYARSPGATFPFSRCFTASNGALNCITCHNPHADTDKSVSYQEGKCLNCHSASSGSKPPLTASASRKPRTGVSKSSGGERVDFAQGSVCPVNPTKGCLDCHMPKVPMSDLHFGLTDHYIRIRTKDPARPDPAKTANNSAH